VKKEAIILGYAGHAYVIIDMLLLNNYKIIGYFDQLLKAKNPYHLSYLGSEIEMDPEEHIEDKSFFLGIGDNNIRSMLFGNMKAKHAFMPYLAHPSSYISESAKIAEGTVLMAGSVVNPLSKIGNGVICNTSSIIEHECEIGDFAHIGPGTVLAGDVTVGNHTFIGANSVVKQGIRIGNNVVVGAGSVIVKDIEDGTLVYGNPGVIKR